MIELSTLPDLLITANYQDAIKKYPTYKYSEQTYFRHKRKQRAEKLERSILNRANSIKLHEEINSKVIEAQTIEDKGKDSDTIKKLLKEDITNRALYYMQQSVTTQWQAAAWWLERTQPENYGKRDAPTSSSNIIGIRLEVCQRDPSVKQIQGYPHNHIPNVNMVSGTEKTSVDIKEDTTVDGV